jgi:predicted dehydrogenase
MNDATVLRLAVLGLVPGNGHPYSWSAIVNGYEPAALPDCPYATIRAYLGAQAPESVGVPGARVTHMWADDAAAAPAIARLARIPTIVARPEDVIGRVDAVLIATDDGCDHVRRVRPFIEAGIPTFVDKPLATSGEDLRTFVAWQQSGRPLLSSSGLRYAPELDPLLEDPGRLGALQWVSSVTANTWERYGIHALEPVFRLTGPGFVSVRLESAPGTEVAHLLHRSGVQVTLPVIRDGAAAFGTLLVCGAAGQASLRLRDTYTAFRRQLVDFVTFVRTGRASYPFADTVEMMTILLAGLRSRAEQSRRVALSEFAANPPSNP